MTKKSFVIRFLNRYEKGVTEFVGVSMKIRSFILLVLFAALSACSHSRAPNGVTDLADTKVILQTMGNGLLGSSIQSLSKDDRNQALEAEYKALEYTDAGKTVTWTSAKNGASGSVTPGQPYQVGSQNCRQYSHSFTINGVPQTVHGSACRNANGTWSPLI